MKWVHLKGLYNVVHGRGMEAGTALTNHPIVKAISFTGGTQTGRYVSQSGAEQFKKMSLEMGGKNAALVFEDADMERHGKRHCPSKFSQSRDRFVFARHGFWFSGLFMMLS